MKTSYDTKLLSFNNLLKYFSKKIGVIISDCLIFSGVPGMMFQEHYFNSNNKTYLNNIIKKYNKIFYFKLIDYEKDSLDMYINNISLYENEYEGKEIMNIVNVSIKFPLFNKLLHIFEPDFDNDNHLSICYQDDYKIMITITKQRTSTTYKSNNFKIKTKLNEIGKVDMKQEKDSDSASDGASDSASDGASAAAAAHS
jgi:hypothetical protein